MYNSFTLAKFKIEITAGKHGLELPVFKGLAFRGAFGNVFRRIVCSYSYGEDCKECLLKEKCAYAYIFNSSPPPNSKALSNLQDVPRPFVIRPPSDTKTYYEPGEALKFNLILIGKAIDYLPYFVIVFREMGEQGLGKQRRKFTLNNIHSINNCTEQLVYSNIENIITSGQFNFNWASLLSCNQKTEENINSNNRLKTISNNGISVMLHFKTPVRLKNKGSLAKKPEFHIFFRQLMRRISSMAYFHQGKTLDADYTGLVERAQTVQLTANNTIWQDWDRYSKRQNRRVPMGGLIGSVAYQGNLDEFIPWLSLGEQIHVGKNTVFGMGEYSMEIASILEG